MQQKHPTNHNKLLTNQDPEKRYVVIYNARGANAVAHVLDKFKLPKFKIDSSGIKPKMFVADYTAFCYETNVISEAHYLSSVLNSSVVNKKVKGFQPRGNYGYRDIGRRPLMLHIPKFNSTLPDHLALVSLSTKCHDMIVKHNFEKKGFKGMRNEASKLLSENIREIDTIVQSLLVA
jgi:hypothetical protein